MSHYIDNQKFSKELGEWAAVQRLRIKSGEKREKIPDYLGECILKICTNLGYKPNFINYPFKEEMIGDAIETCVKFLYNFDSEKSNNAFAYISQIAYFAFIRRIQREKKNHISHLKYIFNEMDIDELSGQLGDEKEHYQTYLDNMKKVLDDMGIEALVMKEKEPVVKDATPIIPEFSIDNFMEC